MAREAQFDGKDEQGKPATVGKVIVFLATDRTTTCDPDEQVRLTVKVGKLEGKLPAEREARLRVLEAVVARRASK